MPSTATRCPAPTSTLLALKAVKGIEVDGGPGHRGAAPPGRLQGPGGSHPQGPGRSRLARRPAVEIRFQWEPTPQVRVQEPAARRSSAASWWAAARAAWARAPWPPTWPAPWPGRACKVGLLDADLYGPSMGMMFGIKDGPEGTEEGQDPPHPEVRPEAHVHGLPGRRGPARHLARPHAQQGPHPVPGRRALGRPGRALHRPAAGHRGRAALPASRTPRWTAPSS